METARVLVSSTFLDMQAECDYLVRFVFSRLYEQLLPQRLHLVDADMRWGVVQKQSDNDKARDLCRPFFIGILGERYGTCPKARARKRTPNTAGSNTTPTRA